MTPQSVEALIAEIEAEDRIDFGDLQIGEDAARSLMARHFCDIDRQLADHGMSAEARLEVMAAIAAHAMVENLVMHLGRLRNAAQGAEFSAWMRRHGMA